jgi:hypothetical protein
VRTVVDDRLEVEARAFELRFACEDCAYFAPEASACTHGYPTSLHRRACLCPGGTLAFCKEFELGAP